MTFLLAALLVATCAASDPLPQLSSEERAVAGDALRRAAGVVDAHGVQALFASGGQPLAEALLKQFGGNAVQPLLELLEAGATKKRSVIPGLLDDLTNPLKSILGIVFGNEDTQPSLERRQVARAPISLCENGGAPSSWPPPVAGACQDVTHTPRRSGNYVWSLANSGRNLFFGTVDEILCKIASPCPTLERIYMLPLKDCDCGTEALVDITPKAADFLRFGVDIPTGLALTELRALGCVSAPSIDGVTWGPTDPLSESSLSDSYFSSASSSAASSSASSTSTQALPVGTNLPAWANGTSNFCVGFAAQYNPSVKDYVQAFLFNGDTGAILGIKRLSDYSQARSSKTVGNRIFFGTQFAESVSPNGFGSVLEWRPTAGDALNFEVVGDFDGVAGGTAEIEYHNGRLFVTTWPNLLSTLRNNPTAATLEAARGAMLMMSPPLSTVGVATKLGWTLKWSNCRDYDTNPVQCRITAGGAIVSHDDQLYWGTMNLWLGDVAALPQLCVLVLANAATFCGNGGAWAGGPIDPCAYCVAFGAALPLSIVTALRATSIFRARNLGRVSGQQIDLLYGYTAFPGPVPLTFLPSLAAPPLFGAQGVNNLFNGYAWSATRHAGEVWIGTYDNSNDLNGLLNGLLTPLLKGLTGFALRIELGTPGADLIRINGTRISTRFESLNGLDNVENYGIRTLRSVHCSHNGKSNDLLFVGTANPASNNPLGGWFLKCLKPK